MASGMTSTDGVEVPEKVVELLKELTGANELIPVYKKQTPFDVVRENDIATLLMFHLAGVPLHATEESNHVQGSHLHATCLHWAAAFGHHAPLMFLIDHGAHVDSRNGNGTEPDPDPDAEPLKGFGQTPLMWAASNDAWNTLNLLIHKYGADLHALDRRGFSVAFHAAFHPSDDPSLLHYLSAQGVDLAITDARGQSLLHHVVRAGKSSTARYLLQVANLNPAAIDDRGRTVLHACAQAGHETVLKILLKYGVPVDVKDRDGNDALALARANPACGAVAALLAQLAKEMAAQPIKPTDTAAAKSDWIFYDSKQQRNFLAHFIIPNLVIFFASFLPILIGGPVFVVVMFMMMRQTMAASRSHSRDLTTTGWYMGALFSGNLCLVVYVLPYVATTWTIIPFAWTVINIIYCYRRCMFGDPGIVHSSDEDVQTIFDLAAKGQQVEKHEYCRTCFVRKPNRSKHCSTTNRCVHRFDHYCVWLGNAIGQGNHVPFVGFCITQIISQFYVFFFTYRYYSMENFRFGGVWGMCGWLDLWFGTATHRVVTFFLAFYCLFALFFVLMVAGSQVYYIGRNLTTNEIWFHARYTDHIYRLGKKIYCMYDKGFIGNWLEFLRPGRHSYANAFGPAPATELSVSRVKAYRDSITRASATSSSSCCGGGGGGHGGGGHAHGGHGHSHGGAGGGRASMQVPSTVSAVMMERYPLETVSVPNGSPISLQQDPNAFALMQQQLSQQLMAARQQQGAGGEVTQQQLEQMMAIQYQMQRTMQQRAFLAQQQQSSSAPPSTTEPEVIEQHHETVGSNQPSTSRKWASSSASSHHAADHSSPYAADVQAGHSHQEFDTRSSGSRHHAE